MDTKKTQKSKKRCCIFSIVSILVLVIVAVLLVVFLVVIPNQNKGAQQSQTLNEDNNDNQGNNNTNDNSDDLNDIDTSTEKPNLLVIPKGLGSFDDSARANSYSPPLNQPFKYGTDMKIRGVNLGGWLVPEPFIVPSIFEDHVNEGVVDEWTLCSTIGKQKCSERLLNHYDTWVTEDDIKTIANAGLNHVRIPIGYWQFDIQDNEPFIYGGWKYLLRGIQWCRKYGIRVMIDFHAAPGSQNGWNHSGRSGEIRFLNKTNPYSKQNVQRFRKIVANVVKFFSKKEFSNVVTMIGVLNEPAVMLTDKETTLAFYKDSYKDIQTSINNKTNNLLLAYHDGFVGLKSWEDTMPKSLFPNAVMDSHSYIIFDAGLIVKPLDEINNFPCTAWANDFKQSANTFGPTICGEFSVASNDCGKWLNGINLGTRYEGTFPSSTPVCDNCTCKGTQDYKNFSKNYKQFLLKFAEKQMDAFEQGSGWFFWNFKTEDHINPHWDYFVGLKEGWIPKDANNRTYGCDLISSVSSN